MTVKVYLVVLSGGYEDPEYRAYGSLEAATADYDRCVADGCLSENGDRIDLLEIDLAASAESDRLPTEPIHSHYYRDGMGVREETLHWQEEH